VDQFRPKEITSQDEEDYALRASFLHKMFKWCLERMHLNLLLSHKALETHQPKMGVV
jgi:hypothetical protein